MQCSDRLKENPKIVRGRLENGLEYTIGPNENHGDRFEAYLEVLSGSADELEHQRGIAHFCEHVTYMGSRKRDSLIGKDVRTNAFTDFHHTVFYTSCPSKMDDCQTKERSLEKALETLADVVEAPTQFTPSRVEKERKAILSEASIINTLEYRKNCATVKALHSENRLSSRFPIGDLDLIKEYTLHDLLDYHSVHYRPSNLHLFVVGDVDPSYATEVIDRVFSRIQEKNDLVEKHFNLNAHIYSGTVKEKRRGLPPAKHEWEHPGPRVHIWENDQIRNLSLEIVRKMPIPEIKTWGDMYQNIVMKLAYRILSINFDILQRGTGPLESVEANDYDCTNEGCRVRSFELHCIPYKWEDALSMAVAQTKFFITQGATMDMFKIVKDSLLLDSNRLDSGKADNKDVINGIMEATTCGRALMLPSDEKELVKDILSRVHVDDVNEMAQKLFPWATGSSFVGINLICSTPPPDRSIGFYGVGEELLVDAFERECKEPLSMASIRPEVNTPSKLLSDEEKEHIINLKPYGEEPGFVSNPMLPKENYYNPEVSKEEVLRSLAVTGDLKRVAETYIDSMRDSFKLRSDLEHITENKPPPPELSKLGEKLLENTKHMTEAAARGKYNNALAELKKPLGSTVDPSCMLYQEKAGKNGIHLMTLNNSIRVNMRLDEIDQMSIRAIIPIEYNYMSNEELMRKKRNILVAAAAMMEGGAMGSLSRLQVEMFCSQHLIDVLISANEDIFSIEMSFPYTRRSKNNNFENSLQILNSLIQNHKIEEDAFTRGLDKIKRDRDAYMQDLQAYGTGDLVSTMSDGKLTYHELDSSQLSNMRLEDVQNSLNEIFRRGAVEISIAGDTDLQEAKSLLVNYIGTIQLPEQKVQQTDRYVLSKDIFSLNGEIHDETPEAFKAEDQHRLITVPDNQERAMVLIGGYAPNSSGILPDGTHMADLMHSTLFEVLSCKEDTNNNVEKLVRTSKELWLHPAFPRAACSLLQEILTNRAFTVLRVEKHLTYESNVDFVLYDVQFAGYYVISVHSSFDKSETILKETRKIIEDFCSGERPVTEYHLTRAKDQVLAKLKKERTTNRHLTSELMGIQSRRMPLKNSLYHTEFEKVIKRITLDDIRLLIMSEVFGFEEPNLWSRIVHTTLA